MKKIRVVFYSPCTVFDKQDRPIKILGMSLFDKIANLTEKIHNSFYHLVNTERVDLSKEVIVFIAPEWYFKHGGYFDPKYDYTYDDMQDTFLTLKDFSESYPSLLIIPGSFYYYVKINNDMLIYNCVAAICCGKIISLIHKMHDGDTTTTERKSVAWGMYKEANVNYDRLKGGKYTDEEMKKLNDTIEKNYQDYYEKIKIDFKLDGIHNYGVFSHEKLKIGLEICQDHQQGRLKEKLKNKMVDIQILTAAGLGVRQGGIVVKNGGYILLCDGADTIGDLIKCRYNKQYDLFEMEFLQSNRIGKNEIYFRSGEGKFDKIDLKKDKYNSDTDVMIYDKAIDIADLEKNILTTKNLFGLFKNIN